MHVSMLQCLSLHATNITFIGLGYFVALFPSGGWQESLNQDLIELNADFNIDKGYIKQISNGLHNNREHNNGSIA